MQVKNQMCGERISGGGDDDPEQDDVSQKKISCFSNIKIFLVSECALMLAQGTVGAYLVSVLTTLERRFNLQSADVGVIASSFEIGNLALILFVSYFGAKAHRPRLIGCGGIVMALGALLSALPEFLTHQYEYDAGDSWHAEDGRDVCSNSSRSDNNDSAYKCGDRANTNMMYLLLIGAQVLLGIGATPVQPLGVSYIDDHVHRKDSSLYIALRGHCSKMFALRWRKRRTLTQHSSRARLFIGAPLPACLRVLPCEMMTATSSLSVAFVTQRDQLAGTFVPVFIP